MRRRVYQVFMAPDDQRGDLPIDPSPWHIGRVVRLPREQWELLLEYAETIDPKGGEELSLCSSNRNGTLVISRSPSWLKKAIILIDRTIDELEKPARFLQIKRNLSEDFDREEYKKMLQAVKCVLQESLRIRKPFRAWLE